MSNNTLVCIVIIACIGGCSTCGVANRWSEVEKKRIESNERLQLGKPIKP